MHPTRERLVAETVLLLDEVPVEDISASLVLKRTGLSRGSLYHFFDDFFELLEAAYIRRFAANVEMSTAALRAIVDESVDQEEFLARLTRVTHATQARERMPFRFERARALARAERNERFRASLGAVQQELTDALTACVEQAQNRGLLNRDFSPRAVAVLIQAYTLGKLVDDIVPRPVEPQEWEQLIDLVARRALA